VTKHRSEILKVHQTYAGAEITTEGDRYMIGEYKTMGVTVTACDCESQNAKYMNKKCFITKSNTTP
jgi:hypothetical protein